MERISAYFKRSFPMPHISLKQRGKIAGSARLQNNELRLNPVLMADNPDKFLHEVIPHEICHLVAYQLYGRVKPHGREWQQLMTKVFGLPPNVYHAMDISKVAGKSFAYRCQCGPVQLSIRRHNKVLRNQLQYRCLKCGVQLVAA